MVKSETNKIKKEPSNSISDSSKKKYKGVRMRSWGSWVSEIRAPNQKTRIWLGSYSTAEAAARAYDAALLCLKGSSSASNLNFPLTASSHYNIPQDMSPKSIQRVAAAAANSFTDNNNVVNVNVNDNVNTPSSSSLVSSPSSMVSSDDVSSLMSSFDLVNDESMAMISETNWYGLEGLQSPKYVDQMLLSASFFDIDSSSHLLGDDLYEESDIPLWNFS
jgi:hypothetical protein